MVLSDSSWPKEQSTYCFAIYIEIGIIIKQDYWKFVIFERAVKRQSNNECYLDYV